MLQRRWKRNDARVIRRRRNSLKFYAGVIVSLRGIRIILRYATFYAGRGMRDRFPPAWISSYLETNEQGKRHHPKF